MKVAKIVGKEPTAFTGCFREGLTMVKTRETETRHFILQGQKSTVGDYVVAIQGQEKGPLTPDAPQRTYKYSSSTELKKFELSADVRERRTRLRERRWDERRNTAAGVSCHVNCF
jgi:hypothetical protein